MVHSIPVLDCDVSSSLSWSPLIWEFLRLVMISCVKRPPKGQLLDIQLFGQTYTPEPSRYKALGLMHGFFVFGVLLARVNECTGNL